MVRFVEDKKQIWVEGGKDTTGLECSICKGWLNHWKKLKGINKDVGINCCHPDHIKTGNKLADRGAHVKKRETPKSEEYIILSQADILDIASGKLFIIPVCEEHNITDEKSILVPKILLVDAEPCKKEE